MEKSTQYFHNKKIPREGFQYTFLSVILIDSVKLLSSSVFRRM